MPRQIIKQPDNKFCIFSTVVDGFIAVNKTEKQILAFYKKEYGAAGVKTATEVLDKINKGIPAYHQFTMSFEEAAMLDELTRRY